MVLYKNNRHLIDPDKEHTVTFVGKSHAQEKNPHIMYNNLLKFG